VGPGDLVAGRYRLERELGSGGMGSVYVARDEKFGERIALKVATASGAAHVDFKARFVREARLGNRLGRAEGFVRALDYGELEGGRSGLRWTSWPRRGRSTSIWGRGLVAVDSKTRS
jgi:serine/threonine-protein kinase